MSGGNGNGNGKRPPHRIPLFESDPLVRQAILEAVSDGMRDADACRAAGVAPGTMRRWKASQGEAYRTFRAEMQRARMDGKRARLRRIREAAEGREVTLYTEGGEPVTINVCPDWKADAWILARQHPEEFSEKRILEHVKGARPEKRRKALDDEQVRDALARAATRLGSVLPS